MGKNRLEAFSDGVIAIVITVMVLELKAPASATIDALPPLWPVFISYVLSFVYVGIYWNNHHHLLHAVKEISGAVLWANLHLLFWLSLIPFVTAWMGENHFRITPTATYGGVLFMASLAYQLLVYSLIAGHAGNAGLAAAIGSDRKGNLSCVLYLAGALASLKAAWLGLAVYAAVAVVWLVPDRRIEKQARRQG